MKHTPAHTSAARRTLTHLSHSLLLFPRGLSVHAWLDIDSTQSTGWLRSAPGSILASRIPQIPRTFPSPCPMCPRANSMWRCLKAAWVARSGEIDTGSWQHRVPRWLGTKASLAQGLAQCSLIAYKLRQKRLERLLLYIFNLTWMESLLK